MSLLLFVLLLQSLTTGLLSAQSVEAGIWKGTIEVPGSPLSIEVDLVNDAGEWSGTYSIPVQEIEDFPLEEVEVDGNDVSFNLGGGIPGNPSFELELSSDGSGMNGSFRQGGATLQASFRRSGPDTEGKKSSVTLDEMEGDLQAFLDSVRTIWEIPGLSVAIVRGGESITVASGERNAESGEPVTSDTQFPIGSTTKAFTATLIGTLVEEGLVAWDDRVVEHLPDFRLMNPDATAALRIRDLLTHTSGLPRHDLLWYLGTEIPREELFARLRYLEPTAAPNQKWQYQNLMYLVVGLLAERVTGESWEELMRDRILRPLGMTDGVTLDIPSLERTSDHAVGHAEVSDEIRVIPYRPLPAIAPAGALNASAAGLVPWLKMNVEADGAGQAAIVGSGTLALIQSPQTVMPGGSTMRGKRYSLYGFGWMISEYRGERLVYHGGGIDGFVTQVTLMPDRKIGVAVMTNRATGLPESVALDVIDMIRGEESYDHAITLARNMKSMKAEVEGEEEPEEVERVAGTRPSHELSAYAGLYAHPAYDTLRITERDGRLHVRYFDVEAPLDHFHYDVFELDTTGEEVAGIRILFNGTLTGEIGSVSVPLEPTIDPIEFTKLPDPRLSDPTFLQKYVGEWAIGGQLFEISERAGVLQIDLPGQPVLTLAPEGIRETGEATFRIKGISGFRVRFARTDDRLTALFLQPNGTFRATRVD